MAKKKLDLEPLDLEPVGEKANLDLEPLDLEPVTPEPQKAPTSTMDKLTTLLQNYGDAATFGYLPQLQAAAEPSLAKAYDVVTGSNVSEDMGDYVQRRDEARKSIQAASERNPGYAMAGQGLGLVPSMFIPGGAIAKGASLPMKALAMGGMGAAQAALTNPGDVEGEVNPLQIGERTANALTGGAVSAAVPFLPAAGEKLRGKAGELAFKALGPFAKEAKSALEKGQIQKIGKQALDDVFGWMPVGGKTILARLEKALGREGKKIGSYMDELAAKGGSEVNRKEIANKMRSELLTPAQDAADIGGAQARNETLEKMIKSFEEGQDEVVGVLDAWRKKQGAEDAVNYLRLKTDDVPVTEEYNKNLAAQLKNAINKTSEGKMGQTYSEVAEPYSLLSMGKNIAKRREGHEIAKQFMAPTMIGGGLGFMGNSGQSTDEQIEGAIKGALALNAIQGARKVGLQTGAKALNTLGKGLEKSGILSKNPWLIPTLMRENLRGESNGKKEE